MQYRLKLSRRVSWSYCQGLLITGQKTELAWFGLIAGTCEFWRPWTSGWRCVKALKSAVHGVSLSWSQTGGGCYRSVSARETGSARPHSRLCCCGPGLPDRSRVFREVGNPEVFSFLNVGSKRKRKKNFFFFFLKQSQNPNKICLLGHTHPQATQRHFLGVQTSAFLVRTIFFFYYWQLQAFTRE